MIRSLLRPAPQIALALLLAASCAKTTSCGCLGNIAPLPQPLDSAHTVEGGAQAYLSPTGLGFLDQNVAVLVANLLPGGLTFWVPETSSGKCTVSGTCPDVNGSCKWPLIGGNACEYDFFICRAQDCPYSGDSADCTQNGASPNGACPIAAKLDNLQIGTATPNTLNVKLTMDVDVGEYGLSNGSCQQGSGPPACRNTIWINGDVFAGIIGVSCDSPGIQLTIDGKEVDIDVELTIDPISQALGVDVVSVTGANGGSLFSANDFNANCGLAGDIINFAKSYVIGLMNSQIQSMLQSQVGKQVDKQFCMPQNFYSAVTCPASQAGVQSVPGKDQNGDAVCCAPGTACASGGGAGCVVKPLGLVGVANLAGFLGKFGAPASANLDLEVFPGQAQPPATEPLVKGGGLEVRVVTGSQAEQPSDCVPQSPPPVEMGQADIDFDTEAKNAGIPSYMVGVGLSGAFLNQAAYEAYNAGLLCLDINSYNESLLNTQLLSPVLPSLAYIAPDAAVYAVLRPQNPPQVFIGAGTIQNGQIVDPLLTLSMKDLRIDLFAVVDERPVRLFSISADVSVPLALAVGANGTSIEVVLGNLQNILVNLNATSTNILAESPQQLLKLIPLVLNLAGPSLAKVPSFSLPSLQGFGLSLFPGDAGVPGIHGIVPFGDGGYQDIGLFADLNTGTPPSGAILPGGVPPAIAIVENREPALADVAPGGTLKAWPTAVVQVAEAAGSAGQRAEADEGGRSIQSSGGLTETGWSIDQGLWSAWARGGKLEVTSPNFLIQGHHSIRFRTRTLGDHGPGMEQTLDFVADYTPPTLDLGIDEKGRWTLSATDNVTPAAKLQWSSKSLSAGGGGAFSGWSTAQPDPNALAAQGPFEVRVRDEVGNVTAAASDPSLPLGGEAEGGGGPAVVERVPHTGCGTAPGSTGPGLWPLLALVALAAVRRRRR